MQKTYFRQYKTKKDFTQYKTKEDFLKDFPIIDGILDLSNQQINDDDLKHILELIGEEPSLKGLDLDDNELTTLPVGVFKRLSSLERLYLSFNKFATLTAGAFKGLSSLKELYLDFNQFTTLTADVFEGLSSLKILSLDFDQLTTLLKSLRSILPNCLFPNSHIVKNGKCIFADDDNAIAKLQSVKENIRYMQKKQKKMFIFNIVVDMTSYYHNDAGVNVVADTIEDAMKIIIEYSQQHCSTPMTTFSQEPDAEYEVFADEDAIYVFPNIGGC